jgi:hypothetical protein
MDIPQLIEVGNTVWEGITMEEIQNRIKDMPERCFILRNNGGNASKAKNGDHCV